MVLSFHLAHLLHQFGGAASFVELHIHLVDSPSADEGIGLASTSAKHGGEAKKEKDMFFHGS